MRVQMQLTHIVAQPKIVLKLNLSIIDYQLKYLKYLKYYVTHQWRPGKVRRSRAARWMVMVVLAATALRLAAYFHFGATCGRRLLGSGVCGGRASPQHGWAPRGNIASTIWNYAQLSQHSCKTGFMSSQLCSCLPFCFNFPCFDYLRGSSILSRTSCLALYAFTAPLLHLFTCTTTSVFLKTLTTAAKLLWKTYIESKLNYQTSLSNIVSCRVHREPLPPWAVLSN